MTPKHIHTPGPDEWRQLVEGVEDYAIFMLDANGHVITWNRGAERIKGYSADQILGEHFSIFYPAEDIDSRKPERELEIVRAEGRIEDEGWRLRRDGSRFWANVVITARRDEQRRLIGFSKVTRDLSARREAEEALRHSEERFRLLVESVSDYAIYMLDSEGYVATWNTGAEKLKGYSAAEVIGRHFSLFFSPEDVRVGKPQRELMIALRDGRFEEESFRVRKDQTNFWAGVTLTPVYDATGTHRGFAKVTRDLTVRLEAERTQRRLLVEQTARTAAQESETRLRASEDRYRALGERLSVILEGVADGITAQDSSGRILFANTAAAKAAGFETVEQLLSANGPEVVQRFQMFDEHGQPIDPAQLPGRRVLRGDPPCSLLMRVRDTKLGRDWWSLIKAKSVLDELGQPEIAINIFHDVTEDRRRAQQQRCLLQANEQLPRLLDEQRILTALGELLVPALGDWCAIYLCDGDVLRSATFVHRDPEMVQLARDMHRRYPPRQDREQGVWRVIRSGESELHVDISDEVLALTAQDEEHQRYLQAVGMRSVMTVPIRVRDRVTGTISLISAGERRRYDRHDLLLLEELGRVTGAAMDNAQLYAEARAARDELAEVARVAELSAKTADDANRVKDEFLATVSHELRTPLSAIFGWSSILRTLPHDPTTVRALEVIHRNAEAQRRIIDDILDVARIITGKLKLEFKPIDYAAIVLAAVDVLRPTASVKRITLAFDHPPRAITVEADPDRLQQVVWNLLSNAVKFSKAGGVVLVTLESLGARSLLSVQDQGRGIEPELLPQVFDRFKQGDSSSTRRQGGLGLGLAIVRQIVELHGGSVSAESPGVDMGATFRVSLPQFIRDSMPSEPPREPVRAFGHRLDGARVLIVDDERDSLELVETLLAHAGATTAAASSAAEALALFRTFRPDVLISDIGMPDKDGYALVEELRKTSSVPAIALTAYASERDRQKAMACGFDAHLAKPADPSELIERVRRHLEKK